MAAEKAPPGELEETARKKMFVYLASSYLKVQPSSKSPSMSQKSKKRRTAATTTTTSSSDDVEDTASSSSSAAVVAPVAAAKQVVYIGRSSHPFVRLEHHNRSPGFTEGPKETSAGAPRWKLDLVLGPFTSGTTRIQEEWKTRTRGYRARILRGLEIGCREQRRRGHQMVWYNDGGEVTKTPHPSRSPSPGDPDTERDDGDDKS